MPLMGHENSFEPRQRNRHRIPYRIWDTFTEFERHHFNKLYSYMWFHQEQFVVEKATPESWKKTCYNTALYSIQLIKRGKNARYNPRYNK